MPTKQQKKYTLSILAGLVVNVILNFIAINTFGAFGAAFATTISQFVVVFAQMYYVRKEMDLRKVIKSGKKYLIASSVMLVICLLFGLIIKNGIASVIVNVFAGVITYFLMLIILRDKYIYEIRDLVVAKLKRKN